MEKVKEIIFDLVTQYGLKVVGAIAVLIIGWWVINLLIRAMKKVMQRTQIEPSLQSFIRSLTLIGLRVMLIISVMTMLGIAMTSFIAVLGAAGLAVGMALQGSLQNFAGGVMILFFKPFKVGDVIEAQGYIGSVSAIQIFSTYMKTADNKVIIIPNGPLATGSLVNYSAQETRRVEWVFGIGYGDDYDKAVALLKQYVDKDKRILSDPEPFFGLKELADSSVNIVVRAWVKSPDYWSVFFDMNETVYKGFEKAGLNIPFPQMDVHLHKQN